MAHYAFLDKNNIVTEVITGRNEWEVVDGITDWEQFYGEIRNQLCKRTSYNSKIRGTYAGIGFTYNPDEDIFVTPQPYASWIRSGSFWNPPTPMPTEGKWSWDEENLEWVEIETLAE
jgi:hypothetical protein